MMEEDTVERKALGGRCRHEFRLDMRQQARQARWATGLTFMQRGGEDSEAPE